MSQATVTLALNASQFDAALQKAQQNLNSFATKIGSSFSGALVGQLGGITAGILGVGAAFSTLQRSLVGGVQLNAQLEQTRISVATLLNQFDGSRFADFNARMAESDKILKSLREKGLYAEATFADLASTLQMTAGGMFTAGIRDGEKQVDMIVAVSQALAALGGDQANLASELRSLTSGNVDGWHRVARAIGMSGEQLRKASADGKLYEVVMARMQPILADAKRGLDTFNSQATILQENLDNLKTDLAQPMFEALKSGLKEINKAFAGGEFKESIQSIAKGLGEITSASLKFLAAIMENLPAIMKFGQILMNTVVPYLIGVRIQKIMASNAAKLLAGAFIQVGRAAMSAALGGLKVFLINLKFTGVVEGVKRSFASLFVFINSGFVGMAAAARASAIKIKAALVSTGIGIAVVALSELAAFAYGKAMEKDAKADAEAQAAEIAAAAAEATAAIEAASGGGGAGTPYSPTEKEKNIGQEQWQDARSDLYFNKPGMDARFANAKSIDEKRNLLKEQAFPMTFQNMKGDGETAVDNQIKKFGEIVDSGNATKEQAARLMELVNIKKEYLRLGEEEKQQAIQNAELQKQAAQDLAILQAEAKGDDKGKEKLEREKQLAALVKAQKDTGLGDAEAEKNANTIMALQDEIKSKAQAKDRSAFEADMEIKKAQASGNTEEVERLEKEKKRKALIAEQKAMGYTDKQAGMNADKLLAYDDAIKAQSKMTAGGDKQDSSPLAASSTMRVGGGGVAVGVGSGMLDESKRQTKLLQQIANAVSGRGNGVISGGGFMNPNPFESNS